MIVMKFGGSSVADREQIEKVQQIIASRKSKSPVVVSSAHKGVTNLLVDCAHEAAQGRSDPSPVINRQREILASLGCPDYLLDELFGELTDLLRGLALIKELTPRSLDYVQSFGERMSVRALADFFTRHGMAAKAFDAWELGFITDSNFGAARPVEGYERMMRSAFESQVDKDTVAIVTGFVGRNDRDEITTVGRNGSDLTATLIGAALHADEVEIWTDTNGVMTADPRLVESARNIPAMTFAEASELAYFGSRVLHPATLVPAIKKRIPVRVLNTNDPEHPGTVIQEQSQDGSGEITSIAHKGGQVVLTIHSERMFGQSGFLARVFEVLGRHEVVIDMISTSEVSVSMTTDSYDNLNAAIRELEDFGRCVLYSEKAILCVVGRNIANARGLGGRVLAALAKEGIDIEMISHGIDSINLSLLVHDSDVKRAVPILHDALFAAE